MSPELRGEENAFFILGTVKGKVPGRMTQVSTHDTDSQVTGDNAKTNKHKNTKTNNKVKEAIEE